MIQLLISLALGSVIGGSVGYIGYERGWSTWRRLAVLVPACLLVTWLCVRL